MKKKIISLALLVFMVAGLLVGCGYSIAEDKMSNYAEFDAETFKKKLLALEIENGDFTANEEKRQIKVDDYIAKELADLAEKTVKNGTIGKNDILYYCYYVTIKDSTDSQTFFTLAGSSSNTMDTSKSTSIQYGLQDVEADSFDKKVYDAISAFVFKDKTDDDKGNLYDITKSKDKIKDGDLIFVTYTESFTLTTEGAKKEDVKYTKLIKLDAEKAFDAALIATEVIAGGSVDSKKEFTLTDEQTGKTTKDGTAYSGIKVDFIVNSGDEITVKDTTYTEKKEIKAADGTTVDLNGEELTYHIFPMYFMDVLENDKYTWENVINDFFGSGIGSSLLPSFKDEKNAKDGQTLKLLIDGDVDEEITPLYTLISNNTSAPETKDEETGKTNKVLLDERMALIKGVVEACSLNDKIVKEYRDEYVYKMLENSYNNTIKNNLAKEVKALIDDEKILKLNGTLPEELVDDVYYIFMQNHRYDFYTGSSKVGDVDTSYYSQYNGSFANYLIATLKVKTEAEAEAKVLAEAKEFVGEIVKIQIVAEAFGVVLTDDEYEDKTYNDGYYASDVSRYGDIGIRAAYQFDDLFDEILIIKGERAKLDEYDQKKEEGETDFEYKFDIVYTADEKIDFVHIKYNFTENSDDSDAED